MANTHFKRLGLLTLVALASMSMLACSNAGETQVTEKVTEKVAAKVEEKIVGAKAAFEPFAIPSGTYVMDKEHGYVTFSYSHFGLSNPQLRFRDIDASVQLDAENLENSRVSAVIKSASIDSGVDRFDEHLNSDGWMDTANHPEITFVSTGFTRTSQTAGTMTGDMTIMGITKPLTFDVTLLQAFEHPMKKKPFMGLEGRGKLMRSDFGLGKYAPNVSDEVTIFISGEFGLAE